MATSAPSRSDSESPFDQALRRAQQFLDGKKYREAGDAFSEALALSPRSAAALLGSAICLRKTRSYAEAQHLLNRALFVYPNDVLLLREQAALYFKRGDSALALATFDRILTTAPDTEDALRGKAESLRVLRRYDDAANLLQAALVKFPRSETLLTQRAWLYYAQERYDEAIEAFLDVGGDQALLETLNPRRPRRSKVPSKVEFLEAACRRLPKNVILLNKLGAAYSAQNRYDVAIETFDRILALDASNEAAALGKVRCLRKSGDFRQAASVLEDNLGKFPMSEELKLQRAHLFRDQGRYDGAVEVFADTQNETSLIAFLDELENDEDNPGDLRRPELLEAIARRFPGSATVMTKLGHFYSEQNQPEKAVEAADSVLKIDPKNEEALTLKITALRDARHFDEASSAIEAALRQLPDSEVILTERASLYYDQKRYKDAAKLYVELQKSVDLANLMASLRDSGRLKDCEQLVQAARAQSPEDVDFLKQEALLFSVQGRYADATKVFERVLNSDRRDEDALVQWCQALRQERRFSEAEKAVRDSIDRHPQNRDLRMQFAWLYFDQSLYDQALEAFDEALNAEPDNPYPDALEWKVRSLRSKPDPIEAEKLCLEALAKHPEHAGLCLERGEIFYDRNEFQNADVLFSRAIDSDSESLPAYLGRVKCLKLLNRSNEALDILRDLKARHPQKFDIAAELGAFYLGRNDLIGAQREFESILAADPESIVGINAMGCLQFNRGNYAKAENLFGQALRLEPNSPDWHCNLAWALLKQAQAIPNAALAASRGWIEQLLRPSGDASSQERNRRDKFLSEAENHCRSTLALQSRYAGAYSCLGNIAFQRGALLESEDYFQQSIRLDAKDAESNMNLGALYAQMGRYQDAEKFLATAKALDRANPRISIELGSLHLQTNNVSQAVQDCREALAANPNGEETSRALALALMRGGDFSEAGQVLKRAIRVVDASKRWGLHSTLCELLIRLGDKSSDPEFYEEALKECSIAISLKPDAASPYFYAGIIHSKLQNYGKGLKFFRECVDKDPTFFDADQNARKLQSYMARDRLRVHGGMYAGLALGLTCFSLLMIIWVLYFRTPKITPVMLGTLSPILLGLVFVAFLLPWLSRLKLPGVEAELTQREQKISAGPIGLVEFGSSSLSSGPR